MTVAISPGKIILLGEHGVIYGKPCLSVAISMKVAVSIEESRFYSVNDQFLDEKKHSYIKKAIELLWDGKPLSITTFSHKKTLYPVLRARANRLAISFPIARLPFSISEI